MRSLIPGLDLVKNRSKPGNGHFLVYFNKSSVYRLSRQMGGREYTDDLGYSTSLLDSGSPNGHVYIHIGFTERTFVG